VSDKIYIAKTGLITATGWNSEMVGAVFRAGLSAYERANYFTYDHHLITLAQVPEESLPPVSEALAESRKCSLRDLRLIRMFQASAEEIFQGYEGEPVPLLLAGPENYPGLNNQIDKTFFAALAQQVDLPIDYSISRINSLGRTGVIDALRHAHHYLFELEYPYVLIGGVDTGQSSAWLQKMDADGRIKSERPGLSDSFVPGDGAGCLLLTADPGRALRHNDCLFGLSTPGFAEEPGHIYSDKAYLGEGLHLALRQTLAQLPPSLRIAHLYSSINGESYWIKELGVAITRSSERFHNLQHEHPADTYGDLGAASGAALISLACYDMRQTPVPAPCLITTASDHAFRAAVCLIPERIEP
jgi:3-oxoacyl-[acyl-carrier-protein] synthase-1